MDGPLCVVPGCGRPARHRGRHANQTNDAAPKADPPTIRRVVEPPAVSSNGQMVCVTLVVPLAEFLKFATVLETEVV